MDVSESLRDLGWASAAGFLGIEPPLSDFERAKTWILPVPYEATTSYGGGTGRGPAAILEASHYVELYDQELDLEPCDVGVATLPALELSGAGPQAAVEQFGRAYSRVLDEAGDRFVIVLGGEHSITAVPVLTWADRLEAESGASRRLSVLQLDAHADLRPSYHGTPYSHASVMHRVRDRVELVSVGVRALTGAERDLVADSDAVHMFLADDIHDPHDDLWMDAVLERLTDDVYLTFDVDCMDPSLVPSTGTPEPGGLEWYPVLRLLRRVFRERTVHACDVVELAPIPGLAAPDFLVAKLVYKLIGYRFFT